jgi:glycosyltransferase involved in cell wall biosynthesis
MSDKSKTLVLLTPGFPKDESDLNCLPVYQSFVKAFKKKFPELNIIVLSFDYPYFKRRYQWHGIEVISFGGKNKGGVQKLLLWNRVNKELDRINKSAQIICLSSMWLSTCALVAKKFADKNNLKHYCWIFGQDAKPGNKYVKRIKPRPEELVALSDFIQCEFQNNYCIKPMYVIPPGIDEMQLGSIDNKREIDILAAGSLIPLKQYDIFLEVISVLKKQFPQVSSYLIGDGPEREKLQRLVDAFGINENVIIAGELSHPTVLEKMRKTKLFLHTSSYEAFGMVCLEALSAGATVISFVKPMNTKIENWYTVKSKEEMIEKAIEVINDTNNKFSKIIPYKIDQTVERFAELFSIK